MRHVIFGDVGGHFGPFKKGLKEVGVDFKTMTIPASTIIVQVGDLIHKGPNSALVVETISTLMHNNPGQWKQLIGNHELPYLTNHPFFYPDRVDDRTAEILEGWFDDGLLHPSYAFTSSTGEDYLVTHAGLTRPNYLDLGEGTAFEIDGKLRNTKISNLMESGTMLNGRYPNNHAGVFWAEAVSELYASWYNTPEPPPFHQIHGHSSLRTWKNGLLRFMYAEWVRDSLESDFDKMWTRFTAQGKNFYAIDHGFESRAFSKTLHGLVVE